MDRRQEEAVVDIQHSPVEAGGYAPGLGGPQPGGGGG